MRDEALRLKAEGMSVRQISVRLGVPRATVGDWVKSRRACPECGGEMGGHGHRYDRCGECRTAALKAVTRERAEQIAEWWAEGLTWTEIRQRLGWSANRMSREMGRMRQYWPGLIPHRYSEERRRNQREARWGKAA